MLEKHSSKVVPGADVATVTESNCRGTASTAARTAVQVERYKEQRCASKARLQATIARIGLLVFTAGVVCLLAGANMGTLPATTPVVGIVIFSAAPLLVGTGVVVISTTGIEVDVLARKNKRWFDVIFALWFVHGSFGAVGQSLLGWTYAMRCLPTLYYVARRQRVHAEGICHVGIPELMIAYLSAFTAALAGPIARGGMAAEEEGSSAFISIAVSVRMGCAAVTAAMLFRMRRAGQLGGQLARTRAFWDATLTGFAMIQVAAATLFFSGLGFLTPGEKGWNAALGGQYVVSGAVAECTSNCVTLVLCLGTLRFKATVVGAVSRLFERHHRMEDGAVVAALLSLEPPAVGDEWWLQDTEALAQNRDTHFYRGEVIEWRSDTMVVAVCDASSCPPSVARRSVIRVPRHITDITTLMDMSQQSLRGVPFDAVTSRMLERWVDGQEVYAASRPCKPGQIDWFISHAWDDHAQGKYNALKVAALEFANDRGRWPVLWLDKCCIDQTDPTQINVALKCLPLYLQACDTLYVLAGEAYFNRLWCIWELYVRFTLAGSSEPSVQVLELVGEGVAHSKLARFRLQDAHCFEPNQEAQLRRAIARSPGGHAAFEAQVQQLALPAAANDVGTKPVPRSSLRRSRIRKRSLTTQQSHMPSAAVMHEEGVPGGGGSSAIGDRSGANPALPQTAASGAAAVAAVAGTNEERLAALEARAFKATRDEGGVIERIEALEMANFGKTGQQGGLKQRLTALEADLLA